MPKPQQDCKELDISTAELSSLLRLYERLFWLPFFPNYCGFNKEELMERINEELIDRYFTLRDGVERSRILETLMRVPSEALFRQTVAFVYKRIKHNPDSFKKGQQGDLNFPNPLVDLALSLFIAQPHFFAHPDSTKHLLHIFQNQLLLVLDRIEPSKIYSIFNSEWLDLLLIEIGLATLCQYPNPQTLPDWAVSKSVKLIVSRIRFITQEASIFLTVVDEMTRLIGNGLDAAEVILKMLYEISTFSQRKLILEKYPPLFKKPSYVLHSLSFPENLQNPLRNTVP